MALGVDIKDMVKARRVNLEELSEQAIAVDAYNALYQFLAIIRGESGEPLADRAGRVTSHLSGIFYRNVNILSLRIRPVYIFDGKPPSLKFMEIERRRRAKKEAVEMYAAALARGDLEGARRYAQATAHIKDYMVEDTKKLLELLGIPWVDAPSEGEATAAHLTIKGLTSATASQDFDSLLFGAKRLVRNLTISGRRKLPNRPVYVEVEPEEIELKALLQDLDISREQLVDIGILIGTDFNPDGFKGVGPAKAIKYVKTYGRLEDIPEILEELKLTDFRAIREIFLEPKVATPERLEWGDVDGQGVIDFLCGERDFSRERVGKALQRLEEAERKRSESLARWFR